MKIRTTDWHYKLYTFVYDCNVPTSLCPYFWSVIWGIVICTILSPFFLLRYVVNTAFPEPNEFTVRSHEHFENAVQMFIGFLILNVVGALIGSITITAIHNLDIFTLLQYYSTVAMIAIGLFMALCIFGVIILCWWVGDVCMTAYEPWSRRRRLASGLWEEDNWGTLVKVRGSKRDGLFKSMWAATVDKVCPILEVEDEL